MQAVIYINEKTGAVTFKPEGADDQETLERFSKLLTRPHIITSRGFEYLKSDVEFYIQPMPSRD